MRTLLLLCQQGEFLGRPSHAKEMICGAFAFRDRRGGGLSLPQTLVLTTPATKAVVGPANIQHTVFYAFAQDFWTRGLGP